jgi:hypothetical protein
LVNGSKCSSNRNLSADLLNAWTPDNRNTDIPSLKAKNLSLGSSDRFLRRSDFIRLKNISVGYNLLKSS